MSMSTRDYWYRLKAEWAAPTVSDDSCRLGSTEKLAASDAEPEDSREASPHSLGETAEKAMKSVATPYRSATDMNAQCVLSTFAAALFLVIVVLAISNFSRRAITLANRREELERQKSKKAVGQNNNLKR